MNTKAHVKGQTEEPTKASKKSADSEQKQSAPEQLAASQFL